MERSLALEPDQSGSESRFHLVQAAHPGHGTLSLQTCFFIGRETGTNRPLAT